MNLRNYIDLKSYMTILEYSEKTRNLLISKFKAENPAITDQQVSYYLDMFEKHKSSPKIEQKDIMKYTFAELEKIIDHNFPKQSILIDDDVYDKAIYNENGLTIYEGDTKDKCIKYGQGEKWCISRRDSLNMFNAYRFRFDEINFYFVFDADLPESNDNKKIVVLIDKNGKYYMANRSNSGDFAGGKEYSWDQIVKIQPKLKNLQKLFKPKPLTPEERRIHNIIKNSIEDDDIVQRLGSYEMAEHYVAYGHKLSGQQFIMLPDALQLKYINMGGDVEPGALTKMKDSVFNRYRDIRFKSMGITMDDVEAFAKSVAQ